MSPPDRGYLLDTDTLSLYLRPAGDSSDLQERVAATPQDHLWISIVTVEEIVRGALNLIQRDRNSARITARYSFFEGLLHDLRAFRTLPYDEGAEQLFRNLPASVKRVGTQDCRIACSALAHGLVLVTRNLQHFTQVPGLAVQDWGA